MRTQMIIAGLLALSCGTGACRGEDVRAASEMPLDLTLWAAGGLASDTTVVRVSATTRSEHGATGVVTVCLPEGISLLAGDTVFSVPTRRIAPPRILRLRTLKAGTFDLKATLTVGETDNRDLLEVHLPLKHDADSLSGGISEVVRAEATLNGRRYRYAGFWLVPLEADEVYSAAEFSRSGMRPRPAEPLIAYCRDCPVAADTVTFVAVISRSGEVIQARLLAKAGQTDLATSAAAGALTRARFRPAQYRDKVITDWVYVRIPVLRAR